MKLARFASMVGIAAFAFALPFSAGASVKKEGAWPGVEKKVTLEFDGRPSDGLRQLAKEAGWSLVVANGVGIDGAGGTAADVHVDVADQPADAVLEALFVGRDVVASRNGALITVTPGASPATMVAVPPPAPLPPATPALQPVPAPAALVAPPVPTVRGEDRNVFGGSLVIHRDEIVHSVTVAGGSLKVEGTITGDLVVAGGSAKVLSGARVVGNATIMGGALKVEKNARIDGDVAIAGGSLKREEGAIIGGSIVDRKRGEQIRVSPERDVELPPAVSAPRSRISAAAHSFGRSVTKMAFLFVLGCVLLALAAPRMEKLRVEIAARPMRSFAVGLVGALVAALGGTLAIAVLCITVIGIPVALVGVLAAVLALYSAVASVLTTFGAAVAGHRTQNPYIHLLLGCAAFLVLSSIPWVGGAVTFAVGMVAVGALIATRAGGLVRRKTTALPTGLV